MKVKSCINPQRWGARIDLDFPRIYVWDCNDIKGLNVTTQSQSNVNFNISVRHVWHLNGRTHEFKHVTKLQSKSERNVKA